MLTTCVVTKWESHRDSKGRVSAKDRALGRVFVLNPNRIVDMTALGTGSKFRFYDNHLDERENFSYVESSSSVADIIASHNDSPASLLVTLPIFPNNNTARHSVNTVIPVEFIAYLDANNANPNTTWIVYIKDGFKRVEALVNYSLIDTFTIIETGSLAGVVQYITYDDGDDHYRKGVRGGTFVIDKTITVLGFSGVEDTDWENVQIIG
jgi:hypothetical protein